MEKIDEFMKHEFAGQNNSEEVLHHETEPNEIDYEENQQETNQLELSKGISD